MSKESNITVYDMAMVTSQMLSCMEERIHALNSEIEVTCFGQEFDPSAFAIAKTDMMIRGGDPNNMRFGDTLSDDQFSGYTFQYCISNPLFGIDWKREQKAVEMEAKKGSRDGLPLDCLKFLKTNSYLYSMASPNLRQTERWRLFRMVFLCFPVTRGAGRPVFGSTYWKTTGWIPSFSSPQTSS